MEGDGAPMVNNHAVRERGVLFKPEMVRAILNNTKFQTRRLMPELFANDGGQRRIRDGVLEAFVADQWHVLVEGKGKNGKGNPVRCPYGVPGDRLWVREALKPSMSGTTVYAEDGTPAWLDGSESVKWKWKVKHLSARYMPRWASRITLEVTEVRVQRVQEISERDADAEGTTCHYACEEPTTEREGTHRCNPIADYQRVWESINGPGSWESNPWVWAISFRRLANGND